MTNRTLQHTIFSAACYWAGSAIILGAFGAHALKAQLSETELATFETGVRYQLIQALAMLFIGMHLRKLKESIVKRVYALWSIGIILFSVSLYFLSTRFILGFGDELRWIGMITPFGGLCIIGGWFYLGIRGYDVNYNAHKSREQQFKSSKTSEDGEQKVA
ncbi:MAG: DUF423 domain-containing protein [Bacteroidia bacterium]|nr:DUF423 domain-containing protein [Bacteroidia bacterium]